MALVDQENNINDDDDEGKKDKLYRKLVSLIDLVINRDNINENSSIFNYLIKFSDKKGLNPDNEILLKIKEELENGNNDLMKDIIYQKLIKELELPPFIKDHNEFIDFCKAHLYEFITLYLDSPIGELIDFLKKKIGFNKFLEEGIIITKHNDIELLKQKLDILNIKYNEDMDLEELNNLYITHIYNVEGNKMGCKLTGILIGFITIIEYLIIYILGVDIGGFSVYFDECIASIIARKFMEDLGDII